MKITKRFLALGLVIIMLLSTCLVANAASGKATMTKGSTYTIDNAVYYSTYTVTGTSKSTTAHVLEFNPANGYVPMAFTGAAGDVLSVADQYAAAVAQGYEVAGVINGGFFDMTRGSLNQVLVSEGRLVSADLSASVGEVATFDAQGNMGHGWSVLHFDITFNGTTVKESLVSVNKRYQYISNASSTKNYVNRFFYYDSKVGSGGQHGFTSTSAKGYEVLCEKLDYTELAVGKTLKAKVISVSSNRNYGTTIPTNDNQFVLFVKSDSSYASYASGLSAGSSISIYSYESSSTEAMNNAYSTMNSAYYLVQNGVDKCASASSIGGHSVNNYGRPWTVFGRKADGTFVYFISTGEKIDLADVATAMIKLGCKDVLRLDGGGSTAMYVNGKGSVYSQGRNVADCLLIVKKSSLEDKTLTTKLKDAVALAKTLSNPTPEIAVAITEAEAVLANTYPAKGLVKDALSKVNNKAILSNLITQAKAEPSSHYSAEDYATLKSAITNGENVLNNASATDAQYTSAITKITNALALSSYNILSVGKSYTVGGATPYSADTTDDGVRLTDGAKCSLEPLTSAYSAWKGNYIDDGAGGKYQTITVDLGETTVSNVYKIYMASNFWGVSASGFVSVWGCNTKDGTYTLIGYDESLEQEASGVSPSVDNSTVISSSMTISSETAQNYRYIEFHVYPVGNFLWVDEVEVIRDDTLLPEEEPAPATGKGDINKDGKMTATDYLMLKKVVMNVLSVDDLKEPATAFARCDMNGDGKLTAIDYFMLKKAMFA